MQITTFEKIEKHPIINNLSKDIVNGLACKNQATIEGNIRDSSSNSISITVSEVILEARAIYVRGLLRYYSDLFKLEPCIVKAKLEKL